MFNNPRSEDTGFSFMDHFSESAVAAEILEQRREKMSTNEQQSPVEQNTQGLSDESFLLIVALVSAGVAGRALTRKK